MKQLYPFRNVLILGGAGFIGSNWALQLLRNTDARVHIFDNLSRPGVCHNLAALRQVAGKSDRLLVTQADVRDAAAVVCATRTATEIYNFAAQVAVTTSIADPRLDFETNVGGTFNVLEGARKSGHRPFVLFTSTNKVYGGMESHALKDLGRRYAYRDIAGIAESQPLDFHSPYGCSKGAADQYVRDYARIYGLPTVVLRMSCIAGPRQFGNEDQGWVAHFLYSALAGKVLEIYGDGRQVRDVLCVQDLLQVFEAVRAARDVTAGQIYNVGGGAQNTVSLLELVEMISQLTGSQVRYQFRQPRPGDQLVYVTDTAKLREHTGWRPRYSVPQTLAEIHRWWAQNRDLFAESAPGRTAVPLLQQAPEAAA
jgi:CDP-paratose 2-epimerase